MNIAAGIFYKELNDVNILVALKQAGVSSLSLVSKLADL